MPGRRSESGSLGDEPVDDRLPILGFDALDFRFLDAFADSLPDFESARRLGVDDLLERVVTDEAWRNAELGVDWRASGAFCGVSSEYGVRPNVRGRQSDGQVAAADYEETVSEAVSLLSGLRPPDGTPVFEFVRHRDETYDGPYAGSAPDVVSMPTDRNHHVATDLVGREFVPIDAFNHRRQGVSGGRRSAFEDGVGVGPLDLVDVAPVAMSVPGAPVPERMTGAVPPGLLGRSSERRAYGDAGFGHSAANDGGNGVEDRSRDLGYV